MVGAQHVVSHQQARLRLSQAFVQMAFWLESRHVYVRTSASATRAVVQVGANRRLHCPPVIMTGKCSLQNSHLLGQASNSRTASLGLATRRVLPLSRIGRFVYGSWPGVSSRMLPHPFAYRGVVRVHEAALANEERSNLPLMTNAVSSRDVTHVSRLPCVSQHRTTPGACSPEPSHRIRVVTSRRPASSHTLVSTRNPSCFKGSM